MGALITEAADSMSAMKYRMNEADKALWMDMKFHILNGIAEGKKHKRFREVQKIQRGGPIVHSSFMGKLELDTKKWWILCMARRAGIWNFMSSRKWAQTGLSLEWCWANLIRKARQRFVERGVENIDIWCCRVFCVTRRRSSTKRGTNRRTR